MPKISELPIQTNAGVNTGDSLAIVDAFTGTTKQIPIGQMDLRYSGVPDGGTTQQVLAKSSGANKDVYWRSLDKSSVGLGQVDNTSDANKPISTATQAALNLKANTSALSAKADTSYVNTQLATKQDKLPVGADGEVLTLVAGIPAWAAGGGGGGAVSSVFGRTGAVTAQVGDYDKTQIGLDQVDNTSDLDKPLSTAAIAALAAKQASLPAGTNGQILSLAAGVPDWIDVPPSLPVGGTTGQALVKTSGTDYAVGWSTIDPGIVASAAQALASGATATLPAGQRKRIKVNSTGGPLPFVLPNGTVDTQELYIQGVSDVNPCILVQTGNVYLGSSGEEVTLTQYKLIYLVWDHGNTMWIRAGGNI